MLRESNSYLDELEKQPPRCPMERNEDYMIEKCYIASLANVGILNKPSQGSSSRAQFSFNLRDMDSTILQLELERYHLYAICTDSGIFMRLAHYIRFVLRLHSNFS